MAKKSQPLLVIWVGMMIMVIIGIGIAAFFARPDSKAPGQNQPSLSKGSGAPAKTYAAFFSRPGPIPSLGPMQNQAEVSPGASANTYSQLSDEVNKITVSIYDVKNGLGQAQFLGSGVIVTGQEVLTNAHIVNNKTNLLVYVFAPQPVGVPVVLSRSDSVNDLALLKISDGSTFSAIGLLGNPEEAVVGDTVLAMGNAFGNGNLLMNGLLMDKNFKQPVKGQIRTGLRTNISISPGTCGGPLVNTKGEVLGISNSENDYFVTPINKALPLIYSNPKNKIASIASAQFV
ncbi:MAG: trypsin-like peptidase domain-containing protein [Deltaproteobacteria bacterium]|nr:trypsin-like peptidase domain-containing protein [Deltaproteobacteria bacterium]